jgi:hypothetical protein
VKRSTGWHIGRPRVIERTVARRVANDDATQATELCEAWRYACIGAGLSRVAYAAAGPTDSTPPVTFVVLGPPTVLTVALLPAQVVDDFRAVADRLAGPLGVPAVRITRQGGQHLRVELLAGDPLAELQVPTADPVATVHTPLTAGQDEYGQPVAIALTGPGAAHIIVQGATGGGKSTGAYGLVGQVRYAPDVRVVGSDVTGLLLKPWAARSDAQHWHALGTSYPLGHVNVLEMAVREMDRRIAAMPPGVDSVPITVSTPLLWFQIEELPGLWRLLEEAGDRKLLARARGLLARLLGESRKAGFRITLYAQRAEANIIGGYEREQASHTLSYRVGSAASLKMLHPDIEAAVAEAHATARPGVALLSAPGVPLVRLRAPYTTYAAYCADVTSADPDAAEGPAA